jgi:alkyl sulfatase BDS1-like metallo-beta-lactamase superfamily hydrolase
MISGNRNPRWYCASILIFGACAASTGVIAASPVETSAEQLLRSRNVEFAREIINIAPGVYTAVGYSPANISMIVGQDGVVIVDTGMEVAHALPVAEAFRGISDKPVKAIVYTHGHGDHTGGAAAFIGAVRPQIWALENLGSEDRPLAATGLTIQQSRGVRQGGFTLPDSQRINNGIAPAIRPSRANAFAAGEDSAPNRTFKSGRQIVNVAGVRLELVASPGETSDQLYVWLPKQRVLFAGDNYYKSFPNLYAIRGTPYRDVHAWIQSLDLMMKEAPAAVVPGHTRPVIGESQSREALQKHRSAIAHVHDKTVEGMNLGRTPDQLVATVRLPPELASDPDLGEYYGRVDWAVRAIYSGYLGWFDGNPTNLGRLVPAEEALRVAQLAGGKEALAARAVQALNESDAQWAAQLADYLLALDADDSRAKLIKADALTLLARASVNALGRNYYLTVANLLRQEAGGAPGSRPAR